MKRLAVFLLILFLAACSSATADDSTLPPPGETVTAFFAYIEAGEYEEAQGLLSGEFSLLEVEEEYRGLIFGSLFHMDMPEEVGEGYAYVAITIRAVDFAAAMDEIMAEAFPWVFEDITANQLADRLDSLLIEILESDAAPIMSSIIGVRLELYEGEWRILSDRDFADAITGGMISFAEYTEQWQIQ